MRKDRSVVYIFSIFFDWGGSVRGCTCVSHTHIHAARGLLRCEPRSQDETPREPEDSRSTKALYKCRPYICTKYIYFNICRAARWWSGLTAFFKHVISFKKRRRFDYNQQTYVTHFDENNRLHRFDYNQQTSVTHFGEHKRLHIRFQTKLPHYFFMSTD